MKIYVLDQLYPGGVELVARRAEVVRWDDPKVVNWHEDADGLMIRLSRITAADLARAKRLKAVVKQGVGVDNIDLAAARDKGVVVCNTPGRERRCGGRADARAYARGGAARRRVRPPGPHRRHDRPRAVPRPRARRQDGWGHRHGQHRHAHRPLFHAAFGARILAYDPYVPADRWPDIPHERLASLDEMWPRADVITPHVPLTAETRAHRRARRHRADEADRDRRQRRARRRRRRAGAVRCAEGRENLRRRPRRVRGRAADQPRPARRPAERGGHAACRRRHARDAGEELDRGRRNAARRARRKHSGARTASPTRDPP